MTAPNKITASLLAGAATVVGLTIASPAAHADNKGKARMLIKEAEHALSEGRCHVEDCVDIFPAAEAKFDKAVSLDPTPATALAHCQLYSDLDSDIDKWATANGKMQKALARCDFAANHPDSDEETRKRALSMGEDIRNMLMWDVDDKEKDAMKVAAAKALYGHGLKMKYDKKSGKITLAYGDLDEKTLQMYISVFWAGHANKILRVAINDNDLVHKGQGDRFFTNARSGITGWVMSEPMAKFKICESLMYGINRDVSAEDWCLYQALIEANAPMFAFRGEEVSWDAKQMSGGGLDLDERIFLPTIEGVYKPAITIAGPVEIDDYQHIMLTKAIAYKIRSSSKYYQDMLAVQARAEKIDKKKKAAYAKQDLKVGGKKGKIVFSDKSFIGWDMPPLLPKNAKGVDCDDLSYKAYAPRKKNKDYELYIKVDGEACNNPPLWSDQDSYSKSYSFMHPQYGGDSNDGCQKKLLVPGDHNIEITAHEVKAAKTGRKQINRDLTISDEYMGYSGKKLFGAKMSCSTKGSGAATSRFE